jgi:hypothetical protein
MGTKRTSGRVRYPIANGGKADIGSTDQIDAIDPSATSALPDSQNGRSGIPLLAFDVRCADHVAPFLDILAKALGELGRAATGG